MNKGLIQVDGKFYKKCQVAMLPTKKATKESIFKADNGKIYILDVEEKQRFESFLNPQHLYLTSDEEIKEGDWVLPFGEKHPWIFKKAPCPMPYWGNSENCKKIVATTDRSLGLPLLTDSFVEEYCKSQGDLKEVNLHYLELITTPYKEENVSVSKELLEQICKYCEDQAVFDKLMLYRDFYYKLKSILKS